MSESDDRARQSAVPPALRVHGGPDPDELTRLGVRDDDQAPLLDFSVNVSRYGPAPAVALAVRGVRLDRYPDAQCRLVRRSLAGAWQVAPEQIAVGNGAAELLFTLVQLLCGNGRVLLTVEPTFSEPAAALGAAGGRLCTWTARPEDGFAVDVSAVADAARACAPTAVYLCNPQNPTGRALDAREVHRLACLLATAAPGAMLILDEAFLGLSTHWQDAERRLPDNVVRVRSFTKEHGLPGLRLGALVGSPALVQRLEATRPTWTVSAPAQAAIVASVSADATAFIAATRARWLEETQALARDLTTVGLAALPSDTVFVLVPLQGAAALRQHLLVEHGILIRDCASFGLPDHVRLCGRPAPDRQRLIGALGARPGLLVTGRA